MKEFINTLLSWLNIPAKIKLWRIWEKAKKMDKNWKTTTAAVLVALSALFTAVAYTLDADPKTVPDWGQVFELVGLAAAAFGLWQAADAKK